MENEIGLALKLSRVAVGKSQWETATRIGIHPSILNRIEAGKVAPAPAVLRSLLAELALGGAASPIATLLLDEARRIAGMR